MDEDYDTRRITVHTISSCIATVTAKLFCREMLVSTQMFLFTALFLGVFGINREPHGPIQEAIQNGVAARYNKENCIWRRGNDKDSCPDPDVRIYLYANDKPRRELDSRESDWLRQDYDPTKENVLLIHGYAGA